MSPPAAKAAETSPPPPPASRSPKPSDAEAGTPPPYTETTPLLASQAEEGENQHEEAQLLEPPQSEAKRTKSWWFWRILWTVLAILVLAVFIKGWIDADDVEVSLSPLAGCLHVRKTDMCFVCSLISKAHYSERWVVV